MIFLILIAAKYHYFIYCKWKFSIFKADLHYFDSNAGILFYRVFICELSAVHQIITKLGNDEASRLSVSEDLSIGIIEVIHDVLACLIGFGIWYDCYL